MRRTLIALVAVGALGLAGCTSGAGGLDKAGPKSVTLTVSVGDRSGSPADQIAQQFAAEVETRSSGAMKVVVQVTDEVDLPADYATSVISAASDGGSDGVAVATRAWRPAGVTSLEPLEVPLLVDDDATLEEATTGPVADLLSTGLRPAGFEPLALIPLGLRMVQAYAAPLVTTQAFRGATIRSFPDTFAADALTSLGADPVWVGGFDFEKQAWAGLLTGALAVLDPSAPNVVDIGTFTANVPVYADVISLALTADAWARLDDAGRVAVRDAATAARDTQGAARLTLPEGAAKACAAGFGVALVDTGSLESFERAFAPVADRIATDPGNAASIAAIREFANTPRDIEPVSTCVQGDTSGTATRAGDQSVIDGSWRMDLPLEEWLARGLPEVAWPTNGGLHTMTFDAGTWRDHDDVVGNPPDATGTFTLAGDRLRVTFGDNSTLLINATFIRDGDTLTISGNDTTDELEALWNGVWRRLG